MGGDEQEEEGKEVEEREAVGGGRGSRRARGKQRAGKHWMCAPRLAAMLGSNLRFLKVLLTGESPELLLICTTLLTSLEQRL